MPSTVRRLLTRRPATPPADAPTPADRTLQTADAAARSICERVAELTMGGPVRVLALIDAVRYLHARRIPGAFAECGVWRGGSVMAMLLALRDLGAEDRDVHLYDTFTGMTEPSEHDVSAFDPPARETWERARRAGETPWGPVFGPEAFGEEQVRATLQTSGYPAARIHVHPGDVERTLPAEAPEQLALLRLDTDWYASTKHELEHLWPRLAPGGVLIVDDVGHWDGARRAVEEHFAAHPPAPLLHRIDYTARIAVKA